MHGLADRGSQSAPQFSVVACGFAASDRAPAGTHINLASAAIIPLDRDPSLTE
jgi:hypothetical protein